MRRTRVRLGAAVPTRFSRCAGLRGALAFPSKEVGAMASTRHLAASLAVRRCVFTARASQVGPARRTGTQGYVSSRGFDHRCVARAEKQGQWDTVTIGQQSDMG